MFLFFIVYSIVCSQYIVVIIIIGIGNNVDGWYSYVLFFCLILYSIGFKAPKLNISKICWNQKAANLKSSETRRLQGSKNTAGTLVYHSTNTQFAKMDWRQNKSQIMGLAPIAVDALSSALWINNAWFLLDLKV